MGGRVGALGNVEAEGGSRAGRVGAGAARACGAHAAVAAFLRDLEPARQAGAALRA